MRVWCGILVLAACIGGVPIAAQAQVATDLTPEERAELETLQDQLFQQMLQNPADLDVTFEYAGVSTRLGDLEAAITALERMLIFAPDLPRVKLELGVLYYRLESYDVARAYFEDAVSGEDVPPEVEERVATFLSEIEDRQKIHRFSGTLFGGLRYQTNANLAPASRNVTLRGLEFELRPDDTEQEDFNVFAAADLLYQYDLQNQGDVIEVTGSGYLSRFRDEIDLNNELAEVTVGPRLDLTRFGVEDANFSPYLLGNFVRLDGEPYLYTLGGGLNGEWPVADDVLLDTTVAARWRAFNNTGSNPNNSDRDGWRYTGEIGARWLVAPNIMLVADANLEMVDARVDFESYWGAGIGGGVNIQVPPPLGTLPWTLSATAGFQHFEYDEPDLTISADAQTDDEVILRAGAGIPLSRSATLLAQVEYRDRDSNYEIEQFDNVALTGAVSWRF